MREVPEPLLEHPSWNVEARPIGGEEEAEDERKQMSIERDKPLVFSGEFITHFIRICCGPEEARRCLPELTLAEYEDIRAGRAFIEGDSQNGVRVETIPGWR